MDLLSSRPLREGSRGGASEFSWEAIKNDKDRENYLGHSLMAPVGRWQQGKDLSWYARDNNPQAIDEERARRAEEIRKIKEAEEDALARALGLPVKVRNLEPEKGVSQDEIKRLVGNVGDEDGDKAEGKGVGFGKTAGTRVNGGGEWEKVEGQGLQSTREREFQTRDRASAPRSGDAAKDRRDGNARSDRRGDRRRRETSREREKHRSRRDRSSSPDRKGGRAGYEDDKRASRRHRDERGGSPVRRKRSSSREHLRDRGYGRRGDNDRPRPESDNDRRRDRSTGRDRGHGRRR